MGIQPGHQPDGQVRPTFEHANGHYQLDVQRVTDAEQALSDHDMLARSGQLLARVNALHVAGYSLVAAAIVERSVGAQVSHTSTKVRGTPAQYALLFLEPRTDV
jgi:hypothetical protein